MKISEIKPFGALPSQRQINHFKKYGKKAFFHFGVNTFSNLEWGTGTEKEQLFNPTDTNVRQWIKTIKAAGFALAILTVKHHDGFCLWPSEYTEHSIKKSPYKNGEGDILREFVDACHEFDIAVGIYLSPWDRNSELWGSDEYSEFYNKQLTEVLTKYGKIDEVWWDAAGSSETRYDWGLWAHTVRNLQPEAVIFGSMGATEYVEMHWIGNEAGYGGDPHYPTINPEFVYKEITNEMNTGTFGGERFIIAEVDTSIRPGWFYHKEQDYFVKSSRQLVDLWFDSTGSSAIMLLNFPPDRRGIIHEIDSKNAIEAHQIISKALAVDYAHNATVTADSVKEGFSPDSIVNGNYDAVYVADDSNITPVLDIKLDGEKTFDTFIIGEYVELGIRINGYKVEALVDGEWKLLADKKSIGYKKAVYFGETKTDHLRLTIYSAAAAPVIRKFSLHSFNDAGYRTATEREALGEKFDILANPSAEVIYDEEGVTAMTGGLYPFNTIKFNGAGFSEYELFIFNGSQFYSAAKGKTEGGEVTILLNETIRTTYQFKIKTDKKPDESLNLRLYEM